MGAMTGLPLTPDILLAAYTQGLFPMDVDGKIRWFSPDPRAIFELDGLKVSRSLRQSCRRYEVRIDTVFEEVIRLCASRGARRPGRRDTTWISKEIIAAYTRLHRLGWAHSVESWRDGELAGGLYGVAIGGAFFGESMFHTQRDASKVALVALVERMQDRGMTLLDTQFMTPHLETLGAVEIPRSEYLRRLREAVVLETGFA